MVHDLLDVDGSAPWTTNQRRVSSGCVSHLKDTALCFRRLHKPVLIYSFFHVDDTRKVLPLVKLAIESVLRLLLAFLERVFADNLHSVDFTRVFFPNL